MRSENRETTAGVFWDDAKPDRFSKRI